MSIRLERRYRFSASHLYRRPDWSEEENRARFGRCSIPPGHGHNYRLFITVTGELDPATGFVVELEGLDALVQRKILDVLDHRHLNSAVADFAEGKQIPSSENVLLWIRRKLEESLPSNVRLVKVRLEEDEDLAAEWDVR